MIRLGTTVVLAGIAALGFAQTRSGATSGSVPIAEVVQSDPAIVQSTLDVFPQIRSTISQRPIRPDNPKYPFPEVPAVPNTLRTGGINPLGPAAVLGAKFPGINFTGSEPPDPDIAVGPQHIVEVVNTNIAFYNKATGQLLFADTLDNNGFFNIGVTPFVFDPKVFYDQGSGRFFVIALELDNGLSKLLVAVSDDSNPNGNWFKYRLEALVTSGGNTFWLDYPGWGYNKDAVVATGNMFPFSAGGVFSQHQVMRKSDMLTGAPITITKFNDFNSFTIQPCKVMENTSNVIYGVSRNNSTSVKLFAYSNLTTTPTMNFTTVTVPNQPTRGDAPSTGGKFLDTIADRVMDSAQRGNSVFACLTVNSGDNRAVVRWMEINPNNWPTSGAPTLTQAGTIDTGAPTHAYMPAINVNTVGAMSVIFTKSSTTITADTMVASRLAGDPAGTIGTPIRLFGSDASTTSNSGRWGDYAAVEVDPSNGTTFWGVHEKFRTNGTWGTIIQSWTTGGGGGGGGNLAPQNVSIVYGTLESGNISGFDTSDDTYYSLNSQAITNRGQYAGYDLDFVLPGPATNFTQADFTVEAIINPGNSQPGFIYFFNYTTNMWDQVRSWKIPTTGDGQITASVLNGFANYVGPNREFRVRVMALGTTSRGGVAKSAFRLRTDLGFLRVQ